jgi:uncharacterized coiled-coil protein SlyX
MSRTRLYPVLALAAVLIAPGLSAVEGQQNVDDLRRRIETIEQRMFQQQLSQPIAPPSQAVQQLEARLRQLEVEIASERISQNAATIGSRRIDPENKKSLEARVDELEAQRARDDATIVALTKRIAALEKPAPRRRR